MLIARVMPCLLLRNAALVKTIQFKAPSCVGDPANAIRTYEDQEADGSSFSTSPRPWRKGARR